MGTDVDAGRPHLTRRERDVLVRIGRGLTNDEVADDLFLSTNSVKTHSRTLFAKIGVTSRTQAAIWLLRAGDPSDGSADDRAVDLDGDPPCGTDPCRTFVGGLRRRADSRERVATATGILMVAGPTDGAGAADALVGEAQRSGLAAPIVAGEVVSAYDTPARPAGLSPRLERLIADSRRAQDDARAVRSESRRVKTTPPVSRPS